MTTIPVHKPPKRFVDDEKGLCISDFGRGLLRKRDDGFKHGVTRAKDAPSIPLHYEVQRSSHGAFVISFFFQGTQERFDIKLACVRGTFGVRPLLYCPSCGSQRFKLYFSRVLFLCRGCLNLTYESRDYMPSVLHIIRKKMRVMRKRGRVKRICYNGKYTRQARAVMREVEALSNMTSHRFSRNRKTAHIVGI